MNFVYIRLRKPTQVYAFTCGDLDLKPGDSCIVRTERGLEYGVCVRPSEPLPDDVNRDEMMTVVRKATVSDEATLHQIEIQERKAMEICRWKIEKNNLPMQLVDAEYTFDKHKIIFHFTAAERVDFRNLVKELAQELKTRIELRHIQVRDEAKIIGGIGMCGRELCCATWMTEFHPVSMKMAKRQNLSLNPGKISGQCGRLLCCLLYENDQYEAPKKKKKSESKPACEDSCPNASCPSQEMKEDRVNSEISSGERSPGEDVKEAQSMQEKSSSVTAAGEETTSTRKNKRKRRRKRKKRSEKKADSQ